MDVAATRATWEAIGASYARARRRPWPQVLEWADRVLPPGGRVLDLACGNGRHAAALAARGHRVLAVDFSRSLLRTAVLGVPGAAVAGEATRLPLRSASFDAALMIAALHNIPGRTARLNALAELARVLKPGAPALLTVWDRWHPSRAAGFLAELPYRALGDAETEFGDRWVAWDADGEKVARYYHFYGRAELREDLRVAGFTVDRIAAVAVARTYPDNLFAEVRR